MRPAVLVRGWLALLALSACVAALAQSSPASSPYTAGLSVSESAGERELGMPLLPSARPERDEPEDKRALSLGLWGGDRGLRIAVRRLRTTDSAAQVLAYYRRALSAHGPVLECLPGRDEPIRPTPDDDALRCDAHRSQSGTVVLMVGTQRNQRLVAVQSGGKETHVQLVRLVLKAD
ncbi:MAG: hypothetical protein O9335_00575 [Inhella sp.]|jgi:hypothetical protein|uniref:hypothetical protein n=1 Tax=Inhella sp. TaxID=1921806 RepID=UPI0022BB0E7A|nr:hypothetical protein [Inhella sp.]MCZ8233629.1 hypothetical protein [Inhella sp.]